MEVWLARRQIAHVRSHRTSIPAGFETSITAAEHAQAADYSAARQRVGILEPVYDAALVLTLTLGGGIDLMSTWTGRVLPPGFLAGTLLVLAVLALLALLGLPFAVYRTFGIEQRFGFNRTTPRVFIADRLKGWALGIVLGGALTMAILWIMATADEGWWLVGWGLWIAFTLVLTLAWPRFIAPIFNRFVPLDDAALRERIDALLARCGFHAKAVYVECSGDRPLAADQLLWICISFHQVSRG